MRSPRSLWIIAAMAGLAACVTVNIYFPAAAAEKAADRIIQDVWGERPAKGGAPAPKGEPPKSEKDRSGGDRSGGGPRSELQPADVLAWLMAANSAHAAANINISTPAVSQLTASMRSRYSQLQPFFQGGGVGLTRDGLVAIRDLQAIPIPSRNQARQLVADENRDRNALYREIAAANGHPEWESEIRATFARRWIAKAGSGWRYQDDSGAWKRK